MAAFQELGLPASGNVYGKSANDGSSTWVLATGVENLDGDHSSWFRRGPTLAVVPFGE